MSTVITCTESSNNDSNAKGLKYGSFSLSLQSLPTLIREEKKEDRYNNIADLFISELLRMKHVTATTSISNKFYELLLFTYENSLFCVSPLNEFYMQNRRKYLKQVLSEDTVFCCDVYAHKDRHIDSYVIPRDNRWYKFLKSEFGPLRQENGKYDCNYKCPELFELIVRKLESLNFDEAQYIQMSEELQQLEQKTKTIDSDIENVKRQITEHKKKLNNTSTVVNENHETIIRELTELTQKLLEYKDNKIRHYELKKTIVSENIIKVKNIKTFISCVKKSDDYNSLVQSRQPSAPAQIMNSPVQYAQAGYITNNDINNITSTENQAVEIKAQLVNKNVMPLY